jgi:hypothetical protein
MKPPIEFPTRSQRSMPSFSQKSWTKRPYAGIEMSQGGIGLPPKPGRSTAITRWLRAKCGICSSQLCQAPESPWTRTRGGPEPIST